MRRRLAWAAVGLGAMLVAVACGAGPGDLDGSAPSAEPDPPRVVTSWPREPTVALPAGPAGTWWPVSSSTQLTPTGIELVASSAVDAMVVDGAGAAWLHSSGKVTRVDPSTGSARWWDLGDDAAFGTATGLRASRQSGVWLVSGAHLRLFDGHRFVRDIPVPAEFRGGEGVSITDMVEVGPEIWVSSPAGVARCAGGAWAMVGPGQLTHVRTLAAEPAGHVWAAGLASKGLSFQTTVARFDGSRWSTPQPSAPRSRGTVVADPTGGVLRHLGRELHRFDGLAWRRLPDIPVLRGQFALPVAPAISPAGVVWLRGTDFLATQVSGWWRRVVDHPSRDLVQMAFTDVDVLVADSAGLLRLGGDRLQRVWLEPGARLGEPPVRALALSVDEAWAISAQGSEPDVILRFSDGRWQEMEPGANPAGLAVGTDGGVWVSAVQGLVRFSGGRVGGRRRKPAGGAAHRWTGRRCLGAATDVPRRLSVRRGLWSAPGLPPVGPGPARGPADHCAAARRRPSCHVDRGRGRRTCLDHDLPRRSRGPWSDGPDTDGVGRDVVAGSVSRPEHHRNRWRSARRVLGLVDP